MTIIVWDGTTLAVDQQFNRGEIKQPGQKLYTYHDKAIAICGNQDNHEALIRHFILDAPWPAFQSTAEYSLVVVATKHECRAYYQNPEGVPVLQPDAFGSGAQFALGALYMGANAIQAVEATIALCTSCGFGIDSWSRV